MTIGRRARAAGWALAAALPLVVACGGGRSAEPAASATPPAVSAAAPAVAPTAAPAVADAALTRAQWLQTVDGYAAAPATIPRAADPAFQRLIATTAWLTITADDFARDGAALLRFFPAVKRLYLALGARAAMDELVSLGEYTLDVYRVMLAAGAELVARLPPGDPTRAARLHGLETMRFGAAIETCALLYLAIDASAAVRGAALERLAEPAGYATHSRDGLQLVLATLDERLLPALRPDLVASYRAVREVVAAAYAARAVPATGPRTTYQGAGPPGLDWRQAGTVTSTTGGFAVDVSVGAIAKRVDAIGRDGAPSAQHWIEWRDGEVEYKAVCFDREPEAALIAAFQAAPGAEVQASPAPGTWLAMGDAGRQGWLRIVSIGARACLASVEGPRGSVTAATAHGFLRSLRAAR